MQHATGRSERPGESQEVFDEKKSNCAVLLKFQAAAGGVIGAPCDE